MKYRDVYKLVCRHAAEHLYSLEIEDEFEPEDAERVEKAISELQHQLWRKAEQSKEATDDQHR